VPADALIGEKDEGFYYAIEMMNESRPEVAASAIGAARGAIDRATDYVRDRDAFDRNVVDYQSAHHRIADPETRLEAARSLTYETARETENGTPEAAGSRRWRNCSPPNSARRSSAGDPASRGYGVFDEYRVESFFRWTKATRVYAGPA
jgi:alkylation response protein AidB-like acyl-CoA dehydrogenase